MKPGALNSMNSWAPLWNGIVNSSIWDEPDYVIKIFLTMLALKDMDHVVRFNPYQIGKLAKKTEQEVLDAIRILSSPDTRRIEKQEFEGRRIQMVEEGWLVLNGEKYRERVQIEMKRNRWRKAQQAKRDREKAAALRNGTALPGESEYVEAHKNGDDGSCDKIVTDNLPPGLQ